jgi:hypothetical protein
MKKYIILTFIILWFLASNNTNAACDQNFYWTLRSWFNRTFNDYYNNYSSYDQWISTYSVDFIEQYDYNNSTVGPVFSWTPWIINRSYIISWWLAWTFLESNSYALLYHPPVRSNNNLVIKYNISYYSKNWSSRIWPTAHTECKYYQITWCWDWIIDSSDWETCDHWTANWTSWNTCSTTCQIIPPIHGSWLGTTTSHAWEWNVPVDTTNNPNF